VRPDASPLVTLGIPLIAAVVGLALILGARRAGPRGTWSVAAVVLGWSVIAAALSLTGVLARFEGRPPPLAPFFVATLLLGLGLGLSRAGIVTIAFLSTPMFHAFGTRPERLNTWVAYFPFVYIALAVMGALVGHVVLFRRLLGKRPDAVLSVRDATAT
jgi:hypothetical protein